MSFAHWRPDNSTPNCELCLKPFTAFTNRRHHCRDCGGIFCSACTAKKVLMPHRGFPKSSVRVCKFCIKFIEARIVISKAAASAVANGSMQFSRAHRNTMAPEEAVLTASHLNRTLDRYRQLYASHTDLPEAEDGAASPSPSPPAATATASSSLPSKLRPSAIRVHLPNALVAEHSLVLPNPAPGVDILDIVMDHTSVAPSASLHRLRNNLTMAHKLAVESDAPEASIYSNRAYY